MSDERPRQRVTVSYQQGTLRLCLVLLLLTIDDVINLESACQRNVDDSMFRTSNTDKILVLKHELLKSMGLPAKPTSLSDKVLLINRSASKFLLDIYKNKAEKNPNGPKSPEFELTENDYGSAMDQSDVITTFMAQRSHQTAGGKSDRAAMIWFDLDDVPAEDQAISALLRLYRGPDAKSHKNRGAFTIAVYQILLINDGGMEVQHVDSANTEAGHEGWITINVTKPLLRWTKHPGDNKGLFVSIHPMNGSDSGTKPEDIRIVWPEGDAKDHQPFMVGFYRRYGSDETSLFQPPRSTDYNERHKQARHVSDRKPGRSCRVNNFSISFKELQWDRRIIAPDEFKSNYCSGECYFPLNGKMTVTNHAIMQALDNLFHPEKIPKSCCAATKLSAIKVVYYVSDDSITMRKWKDMSVQECGCY